MQISITELKKLVKEAVDKKLQEAGMFGIDWEKMKLLQATNRLKGRWRLIMTAVEETGDPEKALAVLKSAVATLELHKSKSPNPEPETPPVADEPFDFSP
jgi:hypothetical protein